DLALREIPREAEWQVLDLGTGSGAIAIAIAGERRMCQVTAVDISEQALAVARENVRALALGNVELELGNWTDPVRDRRFKLVVSNPPYVRGDDEALLKLQHEPQSALAAGEDGLDAIRVLARDCGAILDADGALLIEHGAEQPQAVAKLLESHGWADICCHNDFAGLPRVTVARRSGK
ncbi:MAG: peptide chain release factor N(5)-glutamine methyltransferase, partial [Gammaproteobacteria bacterium]|nr:peptide chain release factor N(5)-glutamine methyltransferase [Gammaproteobacteria bacterium]